MFFDGVIRLSWLGIGSNDLIVGLSAGGGTPQGFEEDEVSESDDCGDPTVPGDVNGDGMVNMIDLLAVMDTCMGTMRVPLRPERRQFRRRCRFA